MSVCVGGLVVRCVLTVVCGVGLLLLGAAGVTEGEFSSCMSPLLSKTLESEKRQTVTNCVLLMNHCETTQESVIHHRRRPLPRVRWPTEHLTAVFEDVLVTIRVLDPVLPRPGTFNLSKTTTKKWV